MLSLVYDGTDLSSRLLTIYPYSLPSTSSPKAYYLATAYQTENASLSPKFVKSLLLVSPSLRSGGKMSSINTSYPQPAEWQGKAVPSQKENQQAENPLADQNTYEVCCTKLASSRRPKRLGDAKVKGIFFNSKNFNSSTYTVFEVW
jgi:hypothetical protein